MGVPDKRVSGRNARLYNKELAAYAWLQAIGTNIAAIGQSKQLSRNKKVQDIGNEQILIGNALQAIANAAQAEILLQQDTTRSNRLGALGNALQSIGNSIQVIGGSDPDGNGNNADS